MGKRKKKGEGKRRRIDGRSRLTVTVPAWLVEAAKVASLAPDVEAARVDRFPDYDIPEVYFRELSVLYALTVVYAEVYGHFAKDIEEAVAADPGKAGDADVFIAHLTTKLLDERFGAVVPNLSEVMAASGMLFAETLQGKPGLRFTHAKATYQVASRELESLAPGSLHAIRQMSLLRHLQQGCPLSPPGGRAEPRVTFGGVAGGSKPHHLN